VRFPRPPRALFNRRWLLSLGSFQFVYRLLDVPVIYLRSAGEDGQLSRARTGGRGAPGTAGKMMPTLGSLAAIVAGEGARPTRSVFVDRGVGVVVAPVEPVIFEGGDSIEALSL
jgi:hypothetical protein